MSKIVWLASYPKSGNTWVRIFLNNYLAGDERPADINDLDEGLHAGSRELFERLTGLESTELTSAEIDRARPAMYRQWALESIEPLFVKVHDAWRRNDLREPIFPAEATAVALYIVRNPLDIVASLANHYALSCDEAIGVMNDQQRALATSTRSAAPQLRQFVSSWSEHARSWLELSALPLHVVRYEDMVQAPGQTFAALLQAAGLAPDAHKVARAIEHAAFERLQQQEATQGFQERMPRSGPFFRRGRAGGWREELTAAQIQRVIADHGPLMARFGYLPGALDLPGAPSSAWAEPGTRNMG